MNITFLGTGPSGRIPRPNCKWYVCKEAEKPNSKSARSQTSTFFEFKGFNFLIDVGEDFKKQSRLIKGKDINAVFLTHGHSDAAYGLPFLKSNKYIKRFNPVVYTEKQTFKVAEEKMPEIAGLNFKFIEPFHEYDFSAKPARFALRSKAGGGGPASGWQEFKLTPFRVEHAFNPRFLTLGYLFEIGKKRVVYASDFKKISSQSKDLIKNADLAILDCAAYKRPIPTHVSFPEILELAKEMKFKKIYLTQVGIAWPHYELAQKVITKQAKNIFLAYDGLKIKF